MRYTILQMPADMRPRERLLREGPDRMSDSELLAIILRVGTGGKNARELAEEILVHVGGLQQLRDRSLSSC